MSQMPSGKYEFQGIPGPSPAMRLLGAAARHATMLAVTGGILGTIYHFHGDRGPVFNFLVFVPFAAFVLTQLYLALYSRFRRALCVGVTFVAVAIGWIALDLSNSYVRPSVAIAEIAESLPLTKVYDGFMQLSRSQVR